LRHRAPTLFPYTTLFRSDGVAAEFLERAAVGLELTADACVVRSHERLHVLGIEIFGAGRRSDEVDEDRGDDLALLAGSHRSRRRDRKSTRLNSSHVAISY